MIEELAMALGRHVIVAEDIDPAALDDWLHRIETRSVGREMVATDCGEGAKS